jgi:MoaA/NifB/PqqE/SkfB family radical SAM enzyme
MAEDKVQIVNFLLTRRCNLSCSYCRISRDYFSSPSEYPPLGYYHNSEMSTEEVLDFLTKIKKHNPNVFILFYGGEPLLRIDLPDIIKFCNDNDIYYSIITNNTDFVQDQLDYLISKVGKIKGLTSSVDPVIIDGVHKDHIYKKSMEGFEALKKYVGIVDDVVAEVVCGPKTIHNLKETVRRLTDAGICSSISVIDIAKNSYYDFSNITKPESLLYPTDEVKQIFKDIADDMSLNVHMRDQVRAIPDILPSNLDCNLHKCVDNLTIDADGSLRLCLRIRGISTPKYLNIKNIIDEEGIMSADLIKDTFKIDKDAYCEDCSWTCPIMSQIATEKPNEAVELISHK